MDANVAALLVAVVGMLGTLTSPVIGQRLAARSRREESEAQQAEAVEVRKQARAEAMLAEKKAAYVGFNAAARRYRAELMVYLHAVHEHSMDDANRTELAEARRGYLSALAEVQIVAPDEVLACVEEIMSRLSSAYDAIKALERGAPKPGGSFNATREALLSIWGVWHEMRRIIRIDLGLEPVPPIAPTALAATPAASQSPSA